MDKKKAVRIINYLRRNEISENAIQHLFWIEAKSLWNKAVHLSNSDKEINDNFIKFCKE